MKGIVYGSGINDAPYRVNRIENGMRIICPFYVVWGGMLERVYSAKFLDKFPSYKGGSVCSEWLLFSNFRLWMVCQDWEGRELDKDILIPGNKEYSPSTCLFVDHRSNSILTQNQLNKGDFPTGVHLDKKNRTYIAQICINKRQKRLGSFLSPEIAEAAYIKAKTEEIRRQGREQSNPSIMIGLFRHAYALEQKLA